MQAPSYAEVKPAPKRDPSRPIRTLANSDQLRLMTKLSGLNQSIIRAQNRRKEFDERVTELTKQRAEVEQLLADLHGRMTVVLHERSAGANT